MTPASVVLSARNRYNAVSDSFFGDLELLQYLYEGELELAIETFCNPTVDTSLVTVASQMEYDFAALRIFGVKMVRVDNGRPLELRSRYEIMSLFTGATPPTGSPEKFYLTEDDKVGLYPAPTDAAWTIELSGFRTPAELDLASTTLTTPTRYHSGLIYYVAREMFGKDQNDQMSGLYDQRWEAHKTRVRRTEAKRKHRGQPAQVQMAWNMRTW